MRVGSRVVILTHVVHNNSPGSTRILFVKILLEMSKFRREIQTTTKGGGGSRCRSLVRQVRQGSLPSVESRCQLDLVLRCRFRGRFKRGP
jgi:hypothetical protein